MTARTRSSAAVALVVGLGWPGLAQVEVPDAMPLHRWKSISHSRPADAPSILLANNGERGFRFVLTYTDSPNVGGLSRPAPGATVVRLHRRDGTIVEPPTPPGGGMVGACNAGSCSYSLIYYFPWQENVLEEAWLETRLPGAAYWVEIPYGFTRNPADRLTPLRALSGGPDIAPAMRSMGEHDQILPWNYVEYEVGPIGNGWDATVRIGNPFDTEAEVVLYRADRFTGNNTFRWDLQTPRSSVAIDLPDGRNLVTGRPVGLRLHDDGLRRSDTFRMSRRLVDTRGWGTVTLAVDDATRQFTVPSSLFSYVHGRPETYPRPPLARVPLR